MRPTKVNQMFVMVASNAEATKQTNGHVYNITKRKYQINQHTTISKYTQQHLKITKIASGTVLENSGHLQ